MKRSLSLAVASGLFILGGLVATSSAQAVGAPAKPEKVTICHRTHSETNPYRMITVSKSAVNGPLNTYTLPNSQAGTQFSSDGGDHAGYLHNGYQKQGQNYVRKYPNNPHVYDPSFSYFGPNKVWEDIIPPFSVDVAKGSLKVGSYAGLNWNAAGKAIYFGTGSSFGYCKKMTAKEFYNSEVAAGQTPAEALKSIRDDNAEEDGGLKPNSLNDLPNTPSHPAGPTPPSDLADLTQVIGGKVWYDDNHNGLQDNGELPATGVEVDLADPSNQITPTSFGPQSLKVSAASLTTESVEPSSVCVPSHTGTVWTACTDADGLFYFDSVPEGLWSVQVIRPDGYYYTYDSSAASDGLAPTLVPAGGAGYMWAGLIDPASAGGWTPPNLTPVDYSSSGSGLANTGLNIPPFIPSGALTLALAGVVTVWGVSRRRSNH